MEEICELLDLIKLRIENLQNNLDQIETNGNSEENDDITAEDTGDGEIEDEDEDFEDEENIPYCEYNEDYLEGEYEDEGGDENSWQA